MQGKWHRQVSLLSFDKMKISARAALKWRMEHLERTWWFRGLICDTSDWYKILDGNVVLELDSDRQRVP